MTKPRRDQHTTGGTPRISGHRQQQMLRLDGRRAITPGLVPSPGEHTFEIPVEPDHRSPPPQSDPGSNKPPKVLLVHGLPRHPERFRHPRPPPPGPHGLLNRGILKLISQPPQSNNSRQHLTRILRHPTLTHKSNRS